jgi:hypothetical protein
MSINDVIAALKECRPVSNSDLSIALLALSNVEQFTNKRLNDLEKSVNADSTMQLQSNLGEAREWATKRAEILNNRDIYEWLGPENTPKNRAANTAL